MLSTYYSIHKEQNEHNLRRDNTEVVIKIDSATQRSMTDIAAREGIPTDSLYRSAVRKYVERYNETGEF